MKRSFGMIPALLGAALSLGAAPPARDDDPEPRKVVYRVYVVRITGDKLSVEEMRKMFPALNLAKVQLMTADDEYAGNVKSGQNWRGYLVYVRSRDRSRD